MLCCSLKIKPIKNPAPGKLDILKLVGRSLSALARPRTAQKIGAHGPDCEGLCDKGEPDFFVRGGFFWPTLLCGRQKSWKDFRSQMIV
jgi:hypothetical protein